MTQNRRAEDPKVAVLRATRCLNPHPEAVTDERFASSDFFDARDLAQVKYEMVRAVREQAMPVTAAAAGFGLSRRSYYQAASALDQGGLPALVPGRPGPKGAHKLTEQVCAMVVRRRDGDYTGIAMGHDFFIQRCWTDFCGNPGTNTPNQDAYTRSIFAL